MEDEYVREGEDNALAGSEGRAAGTSLSVCGLTVPVAERISSDKGFDSKDLYYVTDELGMLASRDSEGMQLVTFFNEWETEELARVAKAGGYQGEDVKTAVLMMNEIDGVKSLSAVVSDGQSSQVMNIPVNQSVVDKLMAYGSSQLLEVFEKEAPVATALANQAARLTDESAKESLVVDVSPKLLGDQSWHFNAEHGREVAVGSIYVGQDAGAGKYVISAAAVGSALNPTNPQQPVVLEYEISEQEYQQLLASEDPKVVLNAFSELSPDVKLVDDGGVKHDMDYIMGDSVNGNDYNQIPQGYDWYRDVEDGRNVLLGNVSVLNLPRSSPVILAYVNEGHEFYPISEAEYNRFMQSDDSVRWGMFAEKFPTITLKQINGDQIFLGSQLTNSVVEGVQLRPDLKFVDDETRAVVDVSRIGVNRDEDGKCWIGAEVNGEIVAHKISEKEYNKWLVLGDRGRFKMAAREFSEFDIEKRDPNSESMAEGMHANAAGEIYAESPNSLLRSADKSEDVFSRQYYGQNINGGTGKDVIVPKDDKSIEMPYTGKKLVLTDPNQLTNQVGYTPETEESQQQTAGGFKVSAGDLFEEMSAAQEQGESRGMRL